MAVSMRSISTITALYVDVLYGSLLGLAEQDVLYGSPPGLAEQAGPPPTTPEPEDAQDAAPPWTPDAVESALLAASHWTPEPVEPAEPALHAGTSSSSSGAMMQPVTKARPVKRPIVETDVDTEHKGTKRPSRSWPKGMPPPPPPPPSHPSA